MNDRATARYELLASAKQRLNQVTDQSGMTQTATLSRLVEWFARQPEEMQAVVMGVYPPDIAADVARLILRRQTKPNAKSADGRSRTRTKR